MRKLLALAVLFLVIATHISLSTLFAEEEQLTVSQLNTLIHNKKFSVIEQHFQKFQKNKVRTDGGGSLAIALVQKIFESEQPNNQELKKLLDTWVANSPQSEVPLIFRSQLYYVVAWKLRGYLPPSQTSEVQIKKFEELLKQSSTDAELALKMNPESTLAIYRVLQILRAAGGERKRFGELFERGTAIDRDNIALYLEMLLMLNPAWGGDAEKMFHFARTTAKHASPDGPVSWILVEAHKDKARFDPMESYLRTDETWEEIESAAKPVLKAYPNTAHYVRTLARMAWSAGRITRAKELFEEATRREPTNWELPYDLAKFYEQQLQDRDSAIEYLSKAIALKQDLPRLYQERGTLFFNGEDWSHAAADFARLCEMRPSNPQTHYLYARTLMHMKKFTEALDALNSSITLLGETPNKFALAARCELHLDMKNVNKAVEDCDRALKLDPSSEKILSLMDRIDKELIKKTSP
jgi:tetratricopeptide (TPR) repeat protein